MTHKESKGSTAANDRGIICESQTRNQGETTRNCSYVFDCGAYLSSVDGGGCDYW